MINYQNKCIKYLICFFIITVYEICRISNMTGAPHTELKYLRKCRAHLVCASRFCPFVGEHCTIQNYNTATCNIFVS